MTNYDELAKNYDTWTGMPLRKYAWTETVAKNLGSLKGKRVLDLACGTGVSTQIISDLGASEIVGVDLSAESIKIAKNKNIQGASYFVGDVFDYDFPKLGKFDVVVGLFVIEYAETKEQILKLFKNIRKEIVPGGKFVSLTINGLTIHPPEMYYGITQDIIPEKMGDRFIDTLHDESGKKLLSVEMYHWDKETIGQLLLENGFSCQWLTVNVSREGIINYGADYWKDYLKNPLYSIFNASIK